MLQVNFKILLVSKFFFPSFILSIEGFRTKCAVAFLSSFPFLNLFNSSVCHQTFSSSGTPIRFETVLIPSWVSFMVYEIGFFGVFALMRSVSYGSCATRMYFFILAIYPPVMPLKVDPPNFQGWEQVRGLRKHLLLALKLLSSFFCDFFRFTSSRIVSQYLLSFLFSWSLTLIYLLMILTVHSQIALIASGFKCFH